jgi:hypothetical protein
MSWDIGGEDFCKRATVTVDKDQVGATLTNFPVYVDLSDLPSTGFWDTVDSAGGDIRVTQSDGSTRVALEVDTILFNTGTETGHIWFDGSSISSSVDTVFYIYWDNSTAVQPAADSTYGSENVWNSDIKMRLAMWTIGSVGVHDILDSTENDNDGRNFNLVAGDLVTGQFGKAIRFSTDEYIKVLSDATIEGMSELSLSCWFRKNDTPANFAAFMYKDDQSNADVQYGLQYGDASPNQEGYGLVYTTWNTDAIDIRSDSALSAGWHLMMATWDGTDIEIFVDGVQHTGSTSSVGSPSGAVDNISSALTIGRGAVDVAGPSIESDMQEARIEITNRDVHWHKACYVNQGDPTTFYTIGSVEQSDLFIPKIIII